MKKIINNILVVIMIIITAFSVPFNASAEISDSYLYWSQTDSSKPWYNMSIADDGHSSCTFGKYGCWIMSYAKLLVQCGVVKQESFTPVEMINWIRDNHYTDNEGLLKANHQNNIGYNFNIGYKGQIKCSSYDDANNKIMQEVNNGNYVIVRLTRTRGGHTVIVDNKRTKQNGYATISNSWNNSNYNVPLSSMKSSYNTVAFLDVFTGDDMPPTVSNIRITNVTNKGFTVSCNATDNAEVKNVLFYVYLPYDKSFKMVEAYGTKNGNTYTYKFNGATKSEEYYVSAVAVDLNDNKSELAVQKQYVTCVNKCAAPKFTVKNISGAKQVKITDATKGATIYYKTSKNGKYKKYSKEIKINSTKTVYAYASKKNYKASGVVSKKISVGKVSKPKFTVKNIQGAKSITLTTTTKGASIYYKTSKKGKYIKYKKPFYISSTKTVYAYAKKSGSKNSSTVSKKISLAKLNKPTGVKASAKSSGSIKVSWKKVKGATKYQVFYSSNKKGSGSKTVVVSGNSVTIKNLKSNKQYYFKVKSIANGKQNSAYSKTVTAKTKKKQSINVNSKIKGTWRYIGEYIYSGDDKYEFYFDGKGKVKVTCYGQDKITKKTVSYKVSSNTVTFSAFGNKYTVKVYSDSSLLSFKVTDNSGYTLSDMLIKTSEVKNFDKYKFESNFYRTSWNSQYFNNVAKKKKLKSAGVGFLYYPVDDRYIDNTHITFIKQDGSYYYGEGWGYALSSNVCCCSYSIGSTYYDVILEKTSTNKANAVIFDSSQKCTYEKWTRKTK